MSVPDWISNAVFYQIFPDRFANGDFTNDPPNVLPWGTKPDLFHFMGGDLRGILAKLDYLVDLGINAIYLNPIFLATSTHRYNATDYFQIDAKLGTLDDFHEFIEAAHQRGIRIILDGVFNHCGRGFFAFNDVVENGAESPYTGWFHISKYPVQAYSPGPAINYQAWWGYKSLPKFNTNNPAVRKYIFDVAQYWLKQGADGWRLDVPNEIDDDTFWAEFREKVLEINPEAYLMGEIWDGNPRWVGADHFDGITHYPLRTTILDLLKGETNAIEFAKQIQKMSQLYPPDNLYALYTLLGSHDTERLYTILEKNDAKTALAFLLQFAFPGVPSIYYGDEIGLEGGKDPDCRRAFPWDESQWNHELRRLIKKLIEIRKRSEALRLGSIQWLDPLENTNGVGILRISQNGEILILINPTGSQGEIRFHSHTKIPEGWSAVDMIGGKIKAEVKNSVLTVNLPEWSGAYFSI